MAQRNLPPYTDEEIRELLHTIIKRVIVFGIALCLVGVLIIGAMALWGGN